ncbi:MAG: di-trans,poly-cis-decaprenylcistransferase [Robiginitomaculum sp.]|nr:MAG: di-trans,poly-cis-decaprenylcistransferase [Robiginitomaculum sp.]
MDGNGRWAAARRKPRKFGHHKGVEAVRRCVEAAGNLGIRYLTIYSFSTENWSRPEDEIKALFDLMRSFVEKDVNRLLANGVRVKVIGARANLTTDLIRLIEDVEKKTSGNDRLFLNIAFNYGGRDELTRVCRALAQKVKSGALDASDITEDVLAAELDTAGTPDPDIILRTSGEQRLSNFLPWQSAYAEFIVLDVLWPDFEQENLEEALNIYNCRERRQGGLSS